MRITRRQWLIGAAATVTVGGLSVPALAASTWREGVIARIVRTHVPDAQVSEADMTAFARAYLANRRIPDSTLAARAVLGPVRGMLPQAMAGRLHKLDNQTVNMFLLATDYFQPDRPPGTVSYLAYPDPYGQGCANPLARFDDAPVPGQA